MTGGRAVILGATGRNLAAGMSGGIAYVLDLDASVVNGAGIELEPLSAEGADDLHHLLSRYAQETESEVARVLLADWERSCSRFTVLIPIEYRKALAANETAHGKEVAHA
jgi:glutamate synthase (NADPH/NADH) large chain